MLAVRRWGLVALSLGAILVFFLMEPDPPEEGSLNLSATNYQSLIDVALSDFEANDSNTESAPQQQVVNGWVARDLLHIQALALADVLDALTQESTSGQVVAADDPRVAALLVLAVLAIALVGITSNEPPNLVAEQHDEVDGDHLTSGSGSGQNSD